MSHASHIARITAQISTRTLHRDRGLTPTPSPASLNAIQACLLAHRGTQPLPRRHPTRTESGTSRPPCKGFLGKQGRSAKRVISVGQIGRPPKSSRTVLTVLGTASFEVEWMPKFDPEIYASQRSSGPRQRSKVAPLTRCTGRGRTGPGV